MQKISLRHKKVFSVVVMTVGSPASTLEYLVDLCIHAGHVQQRNLCGG